MWFDIGLLDVLDIALVSIFAWLGIRFLRQTRARVALLGLGLLGAVYALAQWIGLELTALLFRGFFAAVVLLIVVVFQQDLRRFFEQLGTMLSRSRHPARSPLQDADVLVRTVARLATSRTGALIVLPGKEPLDRHLDGGIALGGHISEPLLLSLFDTSSPGHDGAVVIADGRIERFSTHLPLSSDHAQLGQGGTRHAAGLGLAERCDALCVVVSEERGTVSVARDGRLRLLSRPEDLLDELRAFRAPRATEETRRWSRWAEPAAAVASALVLWFLLIPGATQVTRVVAAPVVVDNLPEDLVLESVDPETVEVTLVGLRRDLLLLSTRDINVHVDGFLARLGRRTFELQESGVTRPDTVSVADFDPERVRIAVRNYDEESDVRPEVPGA